MSQLVAVSSPSSGAELIERYASIRRAFYPQPPRVPMRRPPPRAVRVYLNPIEINRPPRAVRVYDKPLVIAPLSARQAAMAAEAAAVEALVAKRLFVADIIFAACGYFDVARADMVGQTRQPQVSRPRHVVMYLAKELTGRSLPEIGRLLGGRDHTTILHGVRKIARLIELGDPVASDVMAVRARLMA